MTGSGKKVSRKKSAAKRFCRFLRESDTTIDLLLSVDLMVKEKDYRGERCKVKM